MTRIYLAAKFSEKLRMRGVAEMLENHGHEVTATWIDTEHESDATATEDVLKEGAYQCILDLEETDVLVAFSHPQGSTHTGGGRHFEFGYAWANEIPIFVVGPKGEHIFHHLPGVEHFETMHELILSGKLR